MGHQSPTGFRVESAQLKCTSAGAQQQHLNRATIVSVYTAAAHSPASGNQTGCRHGTGMRGPALPTHQKRRSVYPHCPYLKTKQKAPLHPRPFSIQDTGDGRAVVGGHSTCQPVKRICQNTPNEPPRPGGTGLPGCWESTLGIYKNQTQRASLWGINRSQSLEGPQAPLENLYTQRIWNVWPRARSPGAGRADSLHK